MYHSVGNSNWEFSITPEVFEKQIKYLFEKKYKFITTKDLLDIIFGKVKIYGKAALLTFDDGYEDFIFNALPVIKKYKAKAVIFIHTSRSSMSLKNSIPLIGLSQIKEIERQGVEISSHSHSHSNLKKLSVSELENDIQTSTQIIEKEISKKPEVFAYPFGLFTDQTIEILKNNGYKMAFTTDRGMVKMGSDSFRIKRFGISKDTSFIEFKARLTPASDWYENIAGLFKRKKK